MKHQSTDETTGPDARRETGPDAERPTDRSHSGSDDPVPPRRFSRRRLLAAAAVGVAGVAGCAATDTSETTDEPADSDDGTGEGNGDGSPSPGSGTETDDGIEVGRPLASWAGYDPDWEPPTTSPLDADFETEVLVENLEIPWDLSFAPDGSLFITERVGRVRRFNGDDLETVAEPAGAIDAGSLDPGSDESAWLIEGGEGGTLGIAVHPGFPNPPHVFLYYTYQTDDGRLNTVEVYDVEADDPSEPVRTVVDGIAGGTYHNGGRITFGPRNYLWITCGDGLDFSHAQDTSALAGKVLRVTPAGDPASGNPDLGDDADPRIFTYGHRNPQGLAWLPDGTTVVSEHGPGFGGDEFSRLEAGANYGWDAEETRTRRRTEYPSSDVHKPLYNTANTSFAPSGALFYTGDAVPALTDRLLVGGLASQQLIVTTLTPSGGDLPPADEAYEQVVGADWSDDAYAATVHTTLKDELGRIRHVEQSPDGEIYACTSNRDGRASDGFPRETDDVLVRITQN